MINELIPSRNKDIFFKLFILIQKLIAKLFTYYYTVKYSMFIFSYGKNRIDKGFKVKPFAFRNTVIRIKLSGENKIGSNTLIQGSGFFALGKRSFCGEMCVFGCNESIIIGEDVMIAQCVTIRDTDHNFSDHTIPMSKQGISTAPVLIEDNVWIGHGAIILKGVTIGSGSIVAAGAVVNSDIPPNTIVGGIPARKISERH